MARTATKKKVEPVNESDESDIEEISDGEVEYDSVLDEIQGVCTIENGLSEREIQNYVKKAADSEDLFTDSVVSRKKKTTKKQKIRNSKQIEFDDQDLSDTVFQKCYESIVKMIGYQTRSKFVPVGIDKHWKLYKYDEGNFFKKHRDSSKKEGELTSFITVLIYLTDETDGLEGGETSFFSKTEKHTVKPLKGRTVLFLHQINHEGAEVVKGAKLILKSVVMFKANPYPLPTVTMEEEEETFVFEEDEIKLIVGETPFIIPTDLLSDHPKCMITTMLRSSLNGGVVTDENGRKQFEFPTQSTEIFKDVIMPLLKNESLPNIRNRDLKDRVDNEIKFWGFNSPFDPESTLSSHPKWNSPQFSSIFKALKGEVASTIGKFSSYLKVMNAIEGLKVKKLTNDPFKGHTDIAEINKKLYKKSRNNRSYGQKYDYNFKLWLSQNLEKKMMNKYEVIPLDLHYNEDLFLIGADLEAYELCCDLFGKEAVNIKPLSFKANRNQVSGCDMVVSFPPQDKDEDNERYDFHDAFYQSVEQMSTMTELEATFEYSFIKINFLELQSKGKETRSWMGEYNDEYYPSYSIFELHCIVIDVAKCK